MNLTNFYKKKSIQKSFTFLVSIIDTNSQYLLDDLMPEIENFHVLKIDLPNWEFKKELMYYGSIPRSFPVLASEGFEIPITFEEDSDATITRLVNWLQRRTLVRGNGTSESPPHTGFYAPPESIKSLNIVTQVLNDKGENVWNYTYKGCYFLKASNISFDYGSNESIKIEIVFGSDFADYNNTNSIANRTVFAINNLNTPGTRSNNFGSNVS